MSEFCLMIIAVQSVGNKCASKEFHSMLHTSLGLKKDFLGVMFHSLLAFLLFIHLNAFDFVVCVNVQEWPCSQARVF